MVGDIKKSKCTGCKMCADLCPAGAISFVEDEMGFWYPNVDEEKCIECGLCKQKCPALHQDKIPQGNDPIVYAAWTKDSTLRHESTSGGVFFEVAKWFLGQGGVVAGCRYNDDYKGANHFLAETEEELECLRGSKYFQSDTKGIYKAVKSALASGKDVLFCGTPCQNAALSMYLGENQTRIVYMDFICRSINSPLAFREYISELEEIYGSKVVKVHLKNKKTGWQSLATKVNFENGEEYHCDKNEDLWVKGFVGNDLYTRDCCFDCQYRALPRKVADITIGDFWGIVGESAYDMFQGISAVMLNTEKGESLFAEVKERFYCKEKSLEEVLPGNVALLKNPMISEKAESFKELIKERPFSEAVTRSIGIRKVKKSADLIDVFKNLRKDVKKYKTHGKISGLKYLYYNYFSKNVVRLGSAKIIPYTNAIFDLDKTARIFVYGDIDFEIGVNKLKRSKAETHIRMDDNAVWRMRHGGWLFYNTVVEIKDNALLDTGHFTMNGGSVIIVDKKITFGEDVMLGRNIIIYDSDFHQIQDDTGVCLNPPEEVVIEDHVWLTSNVTVLKGVTIGRDSLVSAQTVINRDTPERAVIAGKSKGVCIKDDINWKRMRNIRNENVYKSSKIVLYGYGALGRVFAKKYSDQVVYIIDNKVKKEGVCSFKDFCLNCPQIDKEYIWVVAAGQYFEEVKKQIRKAYPESRIYRVEV